jgi:hypothetical protein
MSAAWLLLLLSAPPGTLVDRVVAVVDKEVITQSELLIEARLALFQREDLEAASADLSPEVLTAFRIYWVDQLLIAAQARHYGAAEVSEDEVDQAVRRVEQRARSAAAYQAFLRRFGISAALVREVVRRDLRNEKCIRERLRLRLAAQGLTSEQKVESALASWMTELQAGAEIRLAAEDGELQLQKGPLDSSQSASWWK